MAAAVPHTARDIADVRDRSAALGIDELTFMPTLSDPDQVEKLSEVVFN